MYVSRKCWLNNWVVGRWTLVPVFVGNVFLKITLSWPLISFQVDPVYYLRIIALWGFFNTACLYDIRLGGTKVLSVDSNKIFLLFFVATFVTVPHRPYVYPYLLSFILISIVALSLWQDSLEFQLPPLWMTCPCVQKYLSNMWALDDEVVLDEVQCK